MGRSANRYGNVRIAMLALLISVASGVYALKDREPEPIPSGFRAVDLGGDTPLLIGETEVTQKEWHACVVAKACPETQHLWQVDAPVTKVNAFDVQAYIAWKSKQDGITYRLPTYEEWLLASADLAPPAKDKLFTAPELAWAADFTLQPQDLRDLGPNKFGLSGMRNAVWEWTMSCEHTEGSVGSDCYGSRIAMGHHAAYLSVFTRDTSKTGCGGGRPPPNVGFRLVLSN